MLLTALKKLTKKAKKKRIKGIRQYDEIGFANTIDRDYKGKYDDVNGFVVMWYNGEESFKKKCKELGLGICEINF